MLDTERNEEFVNLIKEKLQESRFVHSMNVAACAKKLAKKYGCDEEKAYTAGLLHDVMKNAGDSEQLSIIEKAGMELTACEKANKKLWHAIAGTAFIKKELNVENEDIINAVRYHTTARENMSTLEKVIYVADFISDDRNYPGVDEVREAAEISLEKAMMIGLEFCIHEIVERKQILHPDSVDAYNEIVISGQEV
ncbi:MAG: HD domain-containing protein [Ruminococcaceae bacterium]|nr:HD domain-containing protein [Oscillospiraceae bacterium]